MGSHIQSDATQSKAKQGSRGNLKEKMALWYFLKVPVWERNVAMVYQQFINYPHLNVFENIAFPLKQRKIDQSVINDKVMDSLKSVGLVGYENRKIQELSGGQQQRVSLARSLVKNAKILLLDEPLVNLDYKLREQLREEFKNLFSKGLADETILIYSINMCNSNITISNSNNLLQHWLLS